MTGPSTRLKPATDAGDLGMKEVVSRLGLEPRALALKEQIGYLLRKMTERD